MLQSMEGKKVPSVVFKTRQGAEWVDVSSDELFSGKRVVVFSLPGAFTPTCSSTHVPRFNQLAPALKAAGVDEIICMAVNDAFVMNEWQVEQKAERIRFIPDGNGDFTKGMGLLVDKSAIGFGDRSWRYSMVVENGVVEKQFIEPEKPGDPFEVSDADTMLQYLAPNAEKPLDATIFTRKGCPFCAKAKRLLTEQGIEYEELLLNRDYTDTTQRAVTGSTSVPQVYINGNHIGGSDDLEAWLKGR
ncbi:MAG: glutathione peroxidase [Gammaproteobacteria bacterium]|nr:glutathione peroxidase [Gammaproteobacteria bacterium]